MKTVQKNLIFGKLFLEKTIYQKIIYSKPEVRSKYLIFKMKSHFSWIAAIIANSDLERILEY